MYGRLRTIIGIPSMWLLLGAMLAGCGGGGSGDPTPQVQEAPSGDVYVGTELATGLDMGVNTGLGRTDWVTDRDGYVECQYPGYQMWGAVFITVGAPTSNVSKRKAWDYSRFQYLALELKGTQGGEQVSIGVKTNTDPDNGREPKRVVGNLTTDWVTVRIPFSEFIREPYYPATRFERLYLEWLTRLRAYAEYLNQSFPKEDKPAWNPRDDTVLGFDVWREYGAVDPEVQTLGDAPWGELYLGAAFHTTNFYLEDYDSIRSGLNVKAGMRYGQPGRPVMPYIVFDANLTSGHGFFWENRVIGGAGVRTEIKTSKYSKLKLYAEHLWLVGYLKDKPQALDLIPSHDSRIGLTYQLNRY